MNIKKINYSLVIVGNIHNPTVISDYFFIKAGIISDISELDKNQYVVTPGLSQAVIKNTTIIVQPNVLNISSTDFEKPFEIGKKYCNSLGYIKATAIGINFDIIVEDFDFDKFFSAFNTCGYKDTLVKSIDYIFSADQYTKGNVKLTKNSPSNAHFRFNFHRDVINLPLSQIDIDFEESAKIFLSQSEEFIKDILK